MRDEQTKHKRVFKEEEMHIDLYDLAVIILMLLGTRWILGKGE